MRDPNEKEGLTTKATTKKLWATGKLYIITLTQQELSGYIQAAARSGTCRDVMRMLPPGPAPAGRISTN